MPAPIRPRLATNDNRFAVEITDDGSRTLIQLGSGDAYHSGSGAITETRHVYLHNSGAEQLFQSGNRSVFLELGLGSGMSLLVTIEAAIQANASLTYVALEKELPPVDVIKQLDPGAWVKTNGLVDAFLQWRCTLPERPVVGRYVWRVDERRELELHVGDARDWTAPTTTQFNAIYFDPFAPNSSPELWTEALLSRMHQALQPGGRLVTYCVSREIRERLAAVGFDVQRVRGPAGGKRDVLVAEKRVGQS